MGPEGRASIIDLRNWKKEFSVAGILTRSKVWDKARKGVWTWALSRDSCLVQAKWIHGNVYSPFFFFFDTGKVHIKFALLAIFKYIGSIVLSIFISLCIQSPELFHLAESKLPFPLSPSLWQLPFYTLFLCICLI